MLRGEHQTDGTRREVVECSPDVRIDKQTLPRMVQQDRLALSTIVEGDMDLRSLPLSRVTWNEPLRAMSS